VNRTELLEALRGLYGATGEDWSLTTSMSLTEPTCPCAAIVPDDERMAGLTRYTAFADTLDEAIEKACLAAHAELIDGKQCAVGLPYSNKADAEFPAWLAEKRAELAEWRSLQGADKP
jgi:hypothetical protein